MPIDYDIMQEPVEIKAELWEGVAGPLIYFELRYRTKFTDQKFICPTKPEDFMKLYDIFDELQDKGLITKDQHTKYLSMIGGLANKLHRR